MDGEEEELEEFYLEKERALERVLGPMHNVVGHAIIGFAVGGPVDMYYFPNALPGTAFVTQELISPDGTGPIPSKIGTFELIAFTRHALESKKSEPPGRSDFDRIELRLRSIFTDIGNHSFEARLEPMQTCEVSGVEGKPAYVLFDEFVSPRGQFTLNGQRHGLLLCIDIFRSELDFAHRRGVQELVKKLMDAGHYPYSDLDRAPVA